MLKRLAVRFVASLLAVLVVMLSAIGSALAITAVSVDVSSTADCTSEASLELSWTGAGNHSEYGVATDAQGSIIGTFGPASKDTDNWSGPYVIPITTAQAASARIGSYAWVGSNPPSAQTAAEFFVLYNCSTRAVLYRCWGAYGTCPKTAAAAIANLNATATTATATPIPAISREVLVALVLLVAGIGAVFVRRRAADPPPRS